MIEINNIDCVLDVGRLLCKFVINNNDNIYLIENVHI